MAIYRWTNRPVKKKYSNLRSSLIFLLSDVSMNNYHCLNIEIAQAENNNESSLFHLITNVNIYMIKVAVRFSYTGAIVVGIIR